MNLTVNATEFQGDLTDAPVITDKYSRNLFQPERFIVRVYHDEDTVEVYVEVEGYPVKKDGSRNYNRHSLSRGQYLSYEAEYSTLDYVTDLFTLANVKV